jgi:transcriptional regulator with XRE-family HTH domain
MDNFYVPDVSEIRGHRLRAKLTQGEAAKCCCVAQATWARWESGRNQMPPGLWKLFLIELKYKGDVNEANETIPSTSLEQITSTWDEDYLHTIEGEYKQ